MVYRTSPWPHLILLPPLKSLYEFVTPVFKCDDWQQRTSQSCLSIIYEERVAITFLPRRSDSLPRSLSLYRMPSRLPLALDHLRVPKYLQPALCTCISQKITNSCVTCRSDFIINGWWASTMHHPFLKRNDSTSFVNIAPTTPTCNGVSPLHKIDTNVSIIGYYLFR